LHCWNENDFDQLEDWKIARGWANNLMIKLNLKNKGWDSSGEVVTYKVKNMDVGSPSIGSVSTTWPNVEDEYNKWAVVRLN